MLNIIKWGEGENIVSPYFMGVVVSGSSVDGVSSADGNVRFMGTYSPVAFSEDNANVMLIGSNNRLFYPQAGTSIKSFRAYFQLSESAGEVKSFSMNFSDDASTSIETLESASDESDDVWYDMSGRLLNGKPTSPGIYINNGRKFLVK